MKDYSKTGQMASSTSSNKEPGQGKDYHNLTHPHTRCLWKLCLDIPGCSVEAERHGKMQGLHGEWQPDQNFKLGVLQMCKHNEDMKHSFCHRLEIESSPENKKYFFNLLQKLTTKALYSVAKLFSRGTWTKYICLQRLGEGYQAASCASVRLEKPSHLGTDAWSLCLVFRFL